MCGEKKKKNQRKSSDFKIVLLGVGPNHDWEFG